MTTQDTPVHDDNFLKHLVDWLAASLTFATFIQWLPPFVALLTGIWTVTRLYESFTGKQFSESKFAKFVTGRK